MATQHDADELTIIRAAVAGDAAAFEEVVKLYAARLRWLVSMRLDRRLAARVSADDVLQEALITISTAIRSITVESEAAFWTWLCRVVEQRLVDVRRRHIAAGVRDVGREQAIRPKSGQSTCLQIQDFLIDSRTSPSGRLARKEQREALTAALDQLPESFREVIVLRVLAGLSVPETAAIMGRSPGAVSVVLTKAVKRLAEVIATDASSGEGGA